MVTASCNRWLCHVMNLHIKKPIVFVANFAVTTLIQSFHNWNINVTGESTLVFLALVVAYFDHNFLRSASCDGTKQNRNGWRLAVNFGSRPSDATKSKPKHWAVNVVSVAVWSCSLSKLEIPLLRANYTFLNFIPYEKCWVMMIMNSSRKTHCSAAQSIEAVTAIYVIVLTQFQARDVSEIRYGRK